MQDKTLGELVADVGRYKVRLIPVVVLVVVALFLIGTRDQPASSPATEAAASNARAAQQGSASVSGALAEPAGSLPSIERGDDGTVLDAAGGAPATAAPVVDGGPGRPVGPEPYVCEQAEVAPVMEQLRAAAPDIAPYVAGAIGCTPAAEPLSLVTDQVPAVVGAAGPVIELLAVINPFLPPIPVPPVVAVPLPEQLDPALAAGQPVLGPVCGNLGLAVVVPVVLAAFPLPVTGQHISALLANVFSLCGSLTPVPG